MIDTAGTIVVGHTRYKAAVQLGLAQVPVHVAADLSPAQARAYRIADWDFELLPIELSSLEELNVDLSILGFDPEQLLQLMSGEVSDGQSDPDLVPLPPDEAITKFGDLWILGDHRLLCGNSSKVEDVDRLLDGARVHLVNTDPPYNVKVEPRSNNAIAASLSSFESTQHREDRHHHGDGTVFLHDDCRLGPTGTRPDQREDATRPGPQAGEAGTGQ